MTCVTSAAGGAAFSTPVAAMPSQAIHGIVNLVTQWRSATTRQCGSAAQSHWCSVPDSVLPQTRKSQRAGRNRGTGP